MKSKLNSTIALRVFACIALATATNNPTSAETLFVDTFEDGSVRNDVPVDRDGNAVQWFIDRGEGQFAVVDSDLVLTGATNPAPIGTVTGLDLGGTSIRTQLRVREGIGAGLGIRQPNGYFSAITDDGLAFLGITGSADEAISASTDLDVTAEDVVMQLDAFDDLISLWVWRPNEPRPEDPILTLTGGAGPSGSASVFGLSANYPDPGPSEAVFRYVQVATTSIPEPSTWLALVIAALCLPIGLRPR